MGKQHPNIMLGSLSIGCWTGRKVDRKSAGKIEAEAKAKAGTSSASKNLMVDVKSFERLTKHATDCRIWWARSTLPWFDGRGGPRAIHVKGVWEMQQFLGERERQFHDYVAEFLNEYPSLRSARQFDMGDLFDPREFPDPRDMKRRFYFSTSWSALPNADDIRLADGMDNEAAEELVRKAVEAEQQRVHTAVAHAATRLFEVVQSMHDTMAIPIGEKGSTFHDSKLENILKLVELMPTLNLTGDPDLTKLATKAKKLATKAPDELRKDEVKRKAAADEAKKLAADIAGLFDIKSEEDE